MQQLESYDIILRMKRDSEFQNDVNVFPIERTESGAV